MTTLTHYLAGDTLEMTVYERTEDGRIACTGFVTKVTPAEAVGMDYEEVLNGWSHPRVFWSAPVGSAIGYAPKRSA